jgi:hypothetical protein
MDFDKKDAKKVKDVVDNVLKSKEKQTTKDIETKLKGVKKSSGEIGELVDSDGTMLSSRIPLINLTLSPRKTMDQTVTMARTTNDPITRGYRVYYGESEDEKENIVSEVDYSEAFGYVETEGKDFKETVSILKKMGVENPVQRAKEFGKLPKAKKVRGKLKQRLSEKESIEEQQKQKMIKMVEDILTKKSKDSSDVVKRDESVSKILVKNLQSIKKLADKEGISISKLVNILKSSE